MARYRKIDPRIWNDEKFRALSDRGKLAFLFVLTHPSMTCLGAMRAAVDGLAAELGWQPRIFSAALEEAVAAGMVELNRAAAFIGLPNFLRYNEPEGPNSVTHAWRTALDLIPECPERVTVMQRCRAYLDGKSDAFRHAIGDAIRDAFAIPSPILEQEQEQEQEQKTYVREMASGMPSNLKADFARFWHAYPKKRAKGDALKAWCSLKPSAEMVTTILAAIEQHKLCDDWVKDGGRFIPYPASWLRARRWEDDLGPPGNGAGDDTWDTGPQVWECGNAGCPDGGVHEARDKASVLAGRRCPRLPAERSAVNG